MFVMSLFIIMKMTHYHTIIAWFWHAYGFWQCLIPQYICLHSFLNHSQDKPLHLLLTPSLLFLIPFL